MTAETRPKVAIVRGQNLNPWEMQNYDPLAASYDITAYVTTDPKFDLSGFRIPVKRLPAREGLPSYMVGLEEELRDKDIVYTADITWLFTLQAVDARQKYGTRVVALEWENIPFAYDDHPDVAGIVEMKRINCRFVDRFVAVTERAREALLLEGVSPDRISVIPMGIDLARFFPDPALRARGREAAGVAPGERVVLFVGRLVWEKGIFDLIHAAKLLQGDPDLAGIAPRYVVVGKGDEAERAKERAAEIGLSPAFRFIESVPYARMPELFNAADALVLPSLATRYWKEQYGMVLAEAMACGTAVVSTFSGSIPEVVGDAGILVRSEDPRDLAGALKRLLCGEAFRAGLGRRGRERSLALFDSRETANGIDRLFRSLLAEGRSAPG